MAAWSGILQSAWEEEAVSSQHHQDHQHNQQNHNHHHYNRHGICQKIYTDFHAKSFTQQKCVIRDIFLAN